MVMTVAAISRHVASSRLLPPVQRRALVAVGALHAENCSVLSPTACRRAGRFPLHTPGSLLSLCVLLLCFSRVLLFFSSWCCCCGAASVGQGWELLLSSFRKRRGVWSAGTVPLPWGQRHSLGDSATPLGTVPQYQSLGDSATPLGTVSFPWGQCHSCGDSDTPLGTVSFP